MNSRYRRFRDGRMTLMHYRFRTLWTLSRMYNSNLMYHRDKFPFTPSVPSKAKPLRHWHLSPVLRRSGLLPHAQRAHCQVPPPGRINATLDQRRVVLFTAPKPTTFIVLRLHRLESCKSQNDHPDVKRQPFRHHQQRRFEPGPFAQLERATHPLRSSQIQKQTLAD